MGKFSVSKTFSFIAVVVDTGTLYIRIYSRIDIKFEMAPIDYSGPWGKLICEKEPEAENLVSDSFKTTPF